MIDDMNSDYAYSCTVHPDDIVYYDIDRICMFDINPISTIFIQHGHKWKFKEHSYITWYDFWREKILREYKKRKMMKNKEWIKKGFPGKKNERKIFCEKIQKD